MRKDTFSQPFCFGLYDLKILFRIQNGSAFGPLMANLCSQAFASAYHYFLAEFTFFHDFCGHFRTKPARIDPR